MELVFQAVYLINIEILMAHAYVFQAILKGLILSANWLNVPLELFLIPLDLIV